LFESDDVTKLSKDVLCFLLADDYLGVDEFPLFEGVLKWGKAECARQKLDEDKGLKTVLADIIPLIRFPLMSVQDLAQVSSSGFLDQSALVTLFSYCSLTDEKDKKKFKIDFPRKPRDGGGFKAKGTKLLDKKFKKQMLKLFDNKKVTLELLWQGSRDGFDTGVFHSKCDNKGATLTVIKYNQNIFGGYNSESWGTSGNYTNGDTFLYSIHPNLTKWVVSSSGSNAYNGSSYGPTFGGGHDLYVSSSMKSGSSNYTNPSSYQRAANGFSGTYTNTTLAGSYYFTCDEIEVFAVKKKEV